MFTVRLPPQILTLLLTLLTCGWVTEALSSKPPRGTAAAPYTQQRVAPLHPSAEVEPQPPTHGYNLRSRRETIYKDYAITTVPADGRAVEGGVMSFMEPDVTAGVWCQINGAYYTPQTLPPRYCIRSRGGRYFLEINPVTRADNNIKVRFSWDYPYFNGTVIVTETRVATGRVYSPFSRPPPASFSDCVSGLHPDYLSPTQVESWSASPGEAQNFAAWLGGEYYDHGLYLNSETGTEPLNDYLETNPQGRVLVVCDDSNGPIHMREALVMDQGSRVNMVGWRYHNQTSDFDTIAGSGSDTTDPQSSDTLLLPSPSPAPATEQYSKVRLQVDPELMAGTSAVRCTGGSRCTMENFHVTSTDSSCIPASSDNLFLRADKASGQMLNNQFELPDNVVVARGDGKSMLFKGNSVSTRHKLVVQMICGSCRETGSCDGGEPCQQNSHGCPLKTHYYNSRGVISKSFCQNNPDTVQCPVEPSPSPTMQASNTSTSGLPVWSAAGASSNSGAVTGAALSGATLTQIICNSYGGLCPLETAAATQAVPQVANLVAIATAGGLLTGAALLALEEFIRYKLKCGPTLFDLMKLCSKWCWDYHHRSNKPDVEQAGSPQSQHSSASPCQVELLSIKNPHSQE